jgi:hypothetical protein
VAAEPVLGVPEVRPALLDDVSDPTGGRSRPFGRATRCRENPRRISVCRPPMFTSPTDDDDDDEVLEDEEFDEESERDEDDEDLDDEDDEDEETWLVVADCRILTS